MFSSQSLPVSATASTQLQHLALGLVKPHEMLTCPLFQRVSRSLWIAPLPSIVPTAPLSLVSSAEGTLNPAVYVLDKSVQEHQSQDGPLGAWPPPGHRAADSNPLATTVQTIYIHLSVQHSNAHLFTLDIRRCCGTASEALHQSRQKTSVALPLSISAITPSPKASTWVTHNRPW